MGESKTLRVPLRIVFYKEENVWVAHCLEFDLLGDGEDRQSALKGLAEAIAIQVGAFIENGNAANLFSPADGRFFGMFAAGKDTADGIMEVLVKEQIKSASPIIDGVETREYEGAGTELVCV